MKLNEFLRIFSRHFRTGCTESNFAAIDDQTKPCLCALVRIRQGQMLEVDVKSPDMLRQQA